VSDLTATLAVEMIKASAERVRFSAAELSRLDAVAGDGDHGVNMAAAFREAEARLEAETPGDAGAVFTVTGQSFSEGAGGSSGALFGALFGALGARLGGPAAPGARDLVDGLELATKRVALIGRTTSGSKTMLDALEPAVATAREALVGGRDLVDVLAAAAAGAEEGAAATANMRASAGRARHAPNGAVGTKDPGAVTVSIIFAAWAQAVAVDVAS
jgi:dihydroxyacetone kinase